MNRKLMAGALLAACALAGPASASSHREAPFVTKYPQVDATDFYLFSSYESGREDFVTMIANYLPVQAAYGGPNYFPLDSAALYEIHIDNDGDSVEDFTFQFRFTDAFPNDETITLNVGGEEISSVLRNIGVLSAVDEAGLDHLESYTVTLVTGDRRTGTKSALTDATTGATRFRKPFDYAGTKTFGGPGNYSDYANNFIFEVNVPNCGVPARVFVGQRHEAFSVALGEIFDLVNFVPIEGDSAPGAGDGAGFPGGVTQDLQRNTLARNNTTSIALEIHKDCLMAGEPVIGAWTSASLRQANILNPDPTFEKPEVGGGAWTQVSRLSAPLVNELVIGYDSKDRFNASHPRDDGQFLKFVTHPGLPLILDVLFRDAVNDTLAALDPSFTPFADLAPSNFPRNDLVAAFLTGVAGLNQPANVTAGEMLRLNTAIAPTSRELQSTFGVAGGDLAGFPNGRRPGDDTVDIALRVVMGVLCHDLPIGAGGAPANLGFCSPDDAPVGNVPFTDGAPLSAGDLDNSFPYLLTPYPGSPIGAPLPQPAS
ncbi:MAG: DUF4331 domain-containing protein [Gammaproteobacteria bacterium]|nr:DUF4331 domain-containing protein [Gammaproteobacteria bacterium]